jgi:hypothetical protein
MRFGMMPFSKLALRVAREIRFPAAHFEPLLRWLAQRRFHDCDCVREIGGDFRWNAPTDCKQNTTRYHRCGVWLLETLTWFA